MSPLFTSPLIAPLLAFLLALGNAPAWLHWGDCCKIAEVSSLNKCAASTGCQCSSRALLKSSAEDTTLTEADDTSDSSHDSSDCVACRAAMSASPVVASVFETPVVVIVCHESVSLSDSIYLPSADEVDRSRGPPVAATI